MSDEIKYINDISSFIKEISENSEGKTNLYRGQSNAEWGIEASIFRGKYSEEKEEYIYNKIRKYNFEELRKRDYYLDDLIDMQHYGAPTRLIDWTYNPLMSLYFAVAYDTSNDGKLFMYKIDKSKFISFDKEEYRHLSKLLFIDITKKTLDFKEYKDEIKKILLDIFVQDKRLYFIDTTVCNNRIKAQQGCFSLCLEKKKKFFEYIKDDYIESLYRSITIKRESKNKIIWRFLDSIKTSILDKTILSQTEANYSKACVDLIRDKIPIFKNKFENEKLRTKKELSEMNRLFDFFQENASEFFKRWKKQIDSIFIDDDYKLNEKDLISFIIKADDKEKIKRQLENIGITPMVVYPDLKGTIEHINNRYKEEK